MEKSEQPWKEEEEEEEVGLKGRRQRHSEITIIAISDSSSVDLVPPTERSNGAELINQEKDFQEHELQKSTTINGSDNGTDHREIEELKGGEERSEKNVFYDKNDGIWKCRNCCWTYESGSPRTDHMQNPKLHFHLPMNVKTVKQWGPRFISETEGAESTNGFCETEHCGIRCSDSGEDIIESHDNGNGRSTEVNHHYQENPKNNGFSNFNHPPSEKSLEVYSTSYKSSNDKVEDINVSLLKYDDELEVPDLDVERVLEEQETHDLFCPNCNSCITKRVILRKRKRKIRNLSEEAKRNRLETTLHSEFGAIRRDVTYNHGPDAAVILPDGSPALGAEDHIRDREPDVFRCLSCFSIFIPTGSGFKLFRIFDNKSETKNTQNVQQVQTVNKHWFSSIFSSSKGETLLEQGTNAEKSNVGAPVLSTSLNDPSGQASSLQGSSTSQPLASSTPESLEGGETVAPSSIRVSELLGKVSVDGGEKLNGAMEKGKGGAAVDYSTTLSGRTPINIAEPAGNGIFIPQQDGLKLLVSSNVDSLVLDISKTDQKPVEEKRTAVQVLGESDTNGKASILKDAVWGNEQIVGAAYLNESVTEDENSTFRKSDKDGAYSYEVSKHTVTNTQVNIHTEESSKADEGSQFPSVHDSLLLQERQANIIKALKEINAESNAGKETILTVEEPVEQATSQRVPNVLGSAETRTLPHTQIQIQVGGQRVTETREMYTMEIIKSIVYGGLIESITSLGVVSSAAGAEAPTLNVLALGLASMIGELFIIGHNLLELKEGHSRVNSEQEDRYREQLGRRDNFTLHAIVAVLSFVIFGLAPPVIYGFSFRKSDDRDFKLVAVALASLLCIIILAIGKVYVQRPPKSYIKTVLYYVTMGFVASGVSYVVGELIKKLAERLGLFEQSSIITLPVLEKTPMKQPWKSY